MNKDDDGSDINDIEGGAEEEPLNSEDDVTDEDNADLFETDNVVVCQYDKVLILFLLRISILQFQLKYFNIFQTDQPIPQQMEVLLERWHYQLGRQRLRFSKVKR